jgi:hypothetical protein
VGKIVGDCNGAIPTSPLGAINRPLRRMDHVMIGWK